MSSLIKVTNEIISKQSEYLKYLTKLNENENSESENKIVLETIKPSILSYFYIRAWDLCNLGGKDQNGVRVFIETLDQLYPFYLKTFDENCDLSAELKTIITEIVSDIITTINYVAFSHIKFCNKFVEMNGLKILFNYLNNDVLIDNYVLHSKNQESKAFQQINAAIKNAMGTMVCMARTFNNYKNEWKECNSVKNFLNYLSKTKDILDNKIYATLAISFVADDDDIDKLPELKDTLPDLTKLIGMASKAIKDNTNLLRDLFEIDDSNETREVCYIHYLGTDWSLINLIKGLYHLAVNDKLKYDIYYKNNMNKHIRLLIYFGNDIEKEYTLNLLWQLCFDKQIAEDVYNDKAFYDFLKNLSTDDTNDKMVIKNSTGVIWLINKKLNLAHDSPQIVAESIMPAENIITNILTLKKKQTDDNKHVMISYNRDSRDLCLQIKAELEKLDLKVWIDIEAISGSSLESMANAIENSICVLMCMTEKYKQSANCRAEAEYAFQLNKPIIPLIMQKDYKPDGWLGIILGSKIFVNFTRYEFNECIRRLKVELDAVLKNSNSDRLLFEKATAPEGLSTKQEENKYMKLIVDSVNLNRKPVSTNNPEIVKWTEKDVEEWLKKIDIHQGILANIKPCDGKILNELYLMKLETPEFFYRSLSANFTRKPILLKDLAVFSNELRKLFQS